MERRFLTKKQLFSSHKKKITREPLEDKKKEINIVDFVGSRDRLLEIHESINSQLNLIRFASYFKGLGSPPLKWASIINKSTLFLALFSDIKSKKLKYEFKEIDSINSFLDLIKEEQYPELEKGVYSFLKFDNKNFFEYTFIKPEKIKGGGFFLMNGDKLESNLMDNVSGFKQTIGSYSLYQYTLSKLYDFMLVSDEFSKLRFFNFNNIFTSVRNEWNIIYSMISRNPFIVLKKVRDYNDGRYGGITFLIENLAIATCTLNVE